MTYFIYTHRFSAVLGKAEATELPSGVSEVTLAGVAGPVLQLFYVSTMQTTFQLPGRFLASSKRRRKEHVRMSASISVPVRGRPYGWRKRMLRKALLSRLHMGSRQSAARLLEFPAI